MARQAGSFDFVLDTVSAPHDITADVEVIAIQQVEEAYERMQRSDVNYRFCIDMASLRRG
jgi:uncharacterized zinc-type alcohol dehydrogenase-like protein